MITTWLGTVKPDEKLMRVKIELCDTNISRTVTIPARLTLDDMNDVIREAIGWDGSHPWLFHQGRKIRWDVEQYEDEPKPPSNGIWYQSPYEHTIGEVLSTKAKRLYYVYDFGDTWKHLITRMADPEAGATVGCDQTSGVLGRDDVGGASSLMSLVEALRKWDKDCTEAECIQGELSGDMRYWFGWGERAAREKFLAGPTVADVDAKIKKLFTEAPESMKLPNDLDDLSDMEDDDRQ